MRLSLRAGSASSSGSGSGSGSESGAMQALKSLVGSLSLVLANYKPTPVLPANTTSVSNVPLPGGSSAGGGSGGSFLVAGQSNNGTGKGLNLPHQDLDPTQWGSPSTVYVSSGWAGPQIQPGGDSLASTVGPGGCKIQGAYSPSEHLPSATDFPDFDRTKANIMRYRKQVGVNLGSWFVLENWMVPSMFNCARHAASSEHDVLAGYGTSKGGVESARARLEQHWDTWVTKKDFARMAAMGINTVRIPVGYWMMGEDKWLADTPFAAWREVYRNELRYLARAIGWAAAHDMGVLIDLHGAYGSQNGQAHSGVSDGKINFFTGHRNMQRTTDLLVELTQRYANVTNVVGIEALNEPNQGYRSQVYKWYPKAMDAMRRAHNPEAKTLPIFFHDAFSLRAGAQYVASRKDFVVQDNHRYVVYSPSDQRASASEHTTTIEGTVASELRGRSRTARNNLVVGEWSCALAGSSLSGARDAHAAQHRFCNAQAKVYEQATAGWAFWSWRLESCDQNAGWCFQATEHTKLLTSPLHAWSHAGGGGSAGKGKKGKGKGKKGKGKGKGKKKSSSRSVAEGGESGMDATELRTLVAQDVEAMDGPELPYGAAGGRQAASAGAASAGGVRRGTGSAAARARAALERDVAGRTLTAAEAVGNRGFHDGYTSAKVFAASAASLSQLGFGGQYVADSYGAHVTSRALEHSGAHEAAYHTHFAAGLAAAEAKIAALVQQHAQGGV